MGKRKLDVKKFNAVIQFIKFSIVGFSNTVISLFVYYVLLWLKCNYLIANAMSWIISVFNGFYWNNKYVFKNENTWLKALIRTYISYGFSFILGNILLIVLMEVFIKCSISNSGISTTFPHLQYHIYNTSIYRVY